MSTSRPSLVFEAFAKTAAAAVATAMKPAGPGDAMSKFKTEASASKPQWTASNASQATPSGNPVAAQKIAPPPPVQ